jgi:hypothetical protein
VSSKACWKAVLTTGKKSRNKYFSVFGIGREEGFIFTHDLGHAEITSKKSGGAITRQGLGK